jgi:hypothetical protein
VTILWIHMQIFKQAATCLLKTEKRPCHR